MKKKTQVILNQDTAGTGNALGFKFIEKELQTQVHPAATSLLGHIEWLKNEKKNSSDTHPRHCRYRQCPGASS
jgi:hypothetical protein